MRIVAIADTHGFERDLGTLPPGDVLVHVGDLLRRGTLAELEPVADWIRSQPHRRKLVVAGNHDWCFSRVRAEACALLGSGVSYLQDEERTIDGVRFWGSPWQPEFCDWAFNLPRGAPLRAKWSFIPDGIDVLLTHGPPRGFGDFVPEANAREGCDDLLAAVRRVRPALHLFGHIHQDGGVFRDGPVWLANVTTNECERGPTVLDYEPTTRRVTPVLPPGPRNAA
jgi:predicted phosphodiesterase